MGSNMFSLEPDLATGNMVQSQISMSAWALLPPGEKHFVSQLWAKRQKKEKEKKTHTLNVLLSVWTRGAWIQLKIVNQLFKKWFLSGGGGKKVVGSIPSRRPFRVEFACSPWVLWLPTVRNDASGANWELQIVFVCVNGCMSLSFFMWHCSELWQNWQLVQGVKLTAGTGSRRPRAPHPTPSHTYNLTADVAWCFFFVCLFFKTQASDTRLQTIS